MLKKSPCCIDGIAMASSSWWGEAWQQW